MLPFHVMLTLPVSFSLSSSPSIICSYLNPTVQLLFSSSHSAELSTLPAVRPSELPDEGLSMQPLAPDAVPPAAELSVPEPPAEIPAAVPPAADIPDTAAELPAAELPDTAAELPAAVLPAAESAIPGLPEAELPDAGNQHHVTIPE
eukprot:TRINITY_DN21794_c0_g1_i1.p1 TRINITY_DN21794_c0_g1~~TRINITY_DN21794_c0_g1_i1.p1  ORF type:complete len:147 (-),score=57.82 TRINITY_DN21794_c0_g1_i1:74-514(-)